MEETTEKDFNNSQDILYWEKEEVPVLKFKTDGPKIIIKNVSNSQYRNNR